MAIDPYIQSVLESDNYNEVHPCSICRVPNKLRDLKEDAYTPKSIFLGLLPSEETSHRPVQLMVALKWRYLYNFLRQQNQQNVPGIFETRLRNVCQDIPRFEIDIRASYDGSISGSELTKYVIGRNLILDGCFLLQLLSKLEYPTIDTGDPIFETREKLYSAVNDITLLENQIPFIVLKKLYRKTLDAVVNNNGAEVGNPAVGVGQNNNGAEVGNPAVGVGQNNNGAEVGNPAVGVGQNNNGAEVVNNNGVEDVNHPIAQNLDLQNDHRVANIVQSAFGYPLLDTMGCAHILDFMHFSTVTNSRDRGAIPARQELVRCATKLRAAGIIISLKINRWQQKPRPLLDLVDTFDFDISFNDLGELEIPVLYVKETTEVRWRNLIAWEQSKINIKCQYTSYALFFKGLICCESDIALLQKEGVIVLDGCDRSKEDLMTLFSTISKGAEHMDSSFHGTCSRLNEHRSTNFTTIMMGWLRLICHKFQLDYETSRNCIRKGWRDFSRGMQSTPWKYIGISAATLVIGFTIAQTVYTILSYYKS